MLLQLKYKKQLLVVFFIVVLNSAGLCSNGINEDYLWLEFDGIEQNSDGSATQILTVCYGQFPNRIKNVGELDEISVKYSIGEKDKNGAHIFYALTLESKENKRLVRITSKKTNWHLIEAHAKKIINNEKYDYIAKTSFFLFGKSFNNRKGSGDAYFLLNNLDNKIDIRVYREQVKEDFTYNRRRRFPVRAMISFEGKPCQNKSINLIDPSGRQEKFITDKRGEFFYMPDAQAELSLKKNQEPDQDLIIAESKSKDVKYKGTYAIPFGTRGPFLKKGGHNFLFGAILFIVTFVISLFSFLMLSKR